MPSKKQRARQRKVAKAATAPAARPVPPADRTLRQLVRAHDRGIRRGFQRQNTYGDMDHGGGVLSVGMTAADVREGVGAVPVGSEVRVTAPLQPPLAALEQRKGGGVVA